MTVSPTAKSTGGPAGPSDTAANSSVCAHSNTADEKTKGPTATASASWAAASAASIECVSGRLLESVVASRRARRLASASVNATFCSCRRSPVATDTSSRSPLAARAAQAAPERHGARGADARGYEQHRRRHITARVTWRDRSEHPTYGPSSCHLPRCPHAQRYCLTSARVGRQEVHAGSQDRGVGRWRRHRCADSGGRTHAGAKSHWSERCRGGSCAGRPGRRLRSGLVTVRARCVIWSDHRAREHKSGTGRRSRLPRRPGDQTSPPSPHCGGVPSVVPVRLCVMFTCSQRGCWPEAEPPGGRRE